jgi:hypothetical protein
VYTVFLAGIAPIYGQIRCMYVWFWPTLRIPLQVLHLNCPHTVGVMQEHTTHTHTRTHPLETCFGTQYGDLGSLYDTDVHKNAHAHTHTCARPTQAPLFCWAASPASHTHAHTYTPHIHMQTYTHPHTHTHHTHTCRHTHAPTSAPAFKSCRWSCMDTPPTTIHERTLFALVTLNARTSFSICNAQVCARATILGLSDPPAVHSCSIGQNCIHIHGN